jgi:hypothetical protein
VPELLQLAREKPIIEHIAGVIFDNARCLAGAIAGGVKHPQQADVARRWNRPCEVRGRYGGTLRNGWPFSRPRSGADRPFIW